jgi:nicotinate-nucleotide adenylyltransferase
MQKPSHRIGIMGGTFDPIHLGHLRAAEQSRLCFGLDRVVFVTSARPPHKAAAFPGRAGTSQRLARATEPSALRSPMAIAATDQAGRPGGPIADAEARHAMVVLAIASNPCFEASRIELDRPGPSYAVDTVSALREHLSADTQLFFITGADAVLEILTWKEPHRLVEQCELIAVARPGYDLSKLRSSLDAALLKHVHTLEVEGVDISSTEVRRRIQQGLPIDHLTPPEVADYILRRGLYRPDSRT